MIRAEVVDYLEQQEALPFEWGKTDCVQLVAGMIERTTGARPVLPAYSSEIEAKRILVDRGGLDQAVSAFLGPMQRDLKQCSDGDVVLTAFHGQQLLGIALPRRFFVRRANVVGLLPLEIEFAIGWWSCLAL